MGAERTDVRLVGTGIANSDQLKFVASTAEDCDAGAQGTVSGTPAVSSTVLSVSTDGMAFQFDSAPAVADGVLAVCIAFGDEPFALFNDVLVRAGVGASQLVPCGLGLCSLCPRPSADTCRAHSVHACNRGKRRRLCHRGGPA